MKTLLVISFFALSVQLVFSQTLRVDERQRMQHMRIVSGMRSSTLTRTETIRLASEQRHIRRLENRAKADGQITARERVMLDRRQDRAGRHIRRAASNPFRP